MNTLPAVLFYIFTITFGGYALWATAIPTTVKLFELRRWFAAYVFMVAVSGSISTYYYNIIRPIANNENTPLHLTVLDWIITIFVWPAAIFAITFLYKEWKKMKASKQSEK